MRFLAVFKVLGTVLMMLSLSQLPPIIVGYTYGDGAIPAFISSFVITFAFGFLLWFFSHRTARELKTRDGFLVVSLLWLVLSFFSAIPFIVTLYPKLTITQAIFEAVSGLTTTGASAMPHLTSVPHAILYYRQQLHFLGGMGIIVLAVAVLPMLGVGGMQLYRAEVAGPMDSDKLTPRLTHTAKALWYLYFGLTVCCALAYRLAGMTWFQAVCGSFTTVSTGGFSIHESSFAYYNSVAIDSIAIVFMLLGAANFSLHFQLARRRNPFVYFRDPEFRLYIVFYALAALLIGSILSFHDYYHTGRNFLNALFTVVSIGTTTGLTTTNFNLWPTFLPLLLMLIAVIGGCAGSTSGGIKMIRVLVLYEQAKRELQRLIHPKAVYAIKLGNQPLSDRTLQAVWGFIATYIALFCILYLILIALGLDMRTALGALVACLSNTGVGIGDVADGFAQVGTAAKWVLIFAMIAGRLEIFTLIILLTPSYWRS